MALWLNIIINKWITFLWGSLFTIGYHLSRKDKACCVAHSKCISNFCTTTGKSTVLFSHESQVVDQTSEPQELMWVSHYSQGLKKFKTKHFFLQDSKKERIVYLIINWCLSFHWAQGFCVQLKLLRLLLPQTEKRLREVAILPALCNSGTKNKTIKKH